MDEFAAALMAKLVSGNLQMVDESTVQRSTSGPANKLDPHSFLRQQQQQQKQQEQVNTSVYQPTAHTEVNVHTVHAIQEEPQSNVARSKKSNNTLNIDNADSQKLIKIFTSIDKTLKAIATHLTKQ